MTTPAKIAANRRNALASTGPRTPEGKRRAAANAIRHGLLCRSVLLPTEDPAELSAVARRLRAGLAPEGAVEELLADRIIACAWRLWRAMRVEVSLFEQGQQDFDNMLGLIKVMRQAAGQDDVGGDERSIPDYRLGMLFAKTDPGADHFGKFSRYEASLERSLYRALHELQRLQAARQGKAVLPPVAVDVEVTGTS